MLIAHQIQARSYEDVNHYLFGSRIGGWVSIFALIVIVCVNGVMLAGAGSVFVQQLNFHYQTGLLLTVVSSYFIINRGMSAILSLNSLVVPTMLVFTVIIVTDTLHMPNAGRVFTMTTDTSWYAAWTAPLLYSAFNLAMAQAVLVPLGASMPNQKIIRIGGAIGASSSACCCWQPIWLCLCICRAYSSSTFRWGDRPYARCHYPNFIYVLLIFRKYSRPSSPICTALRSSFTNAPECRRR